MSVCSRVGCEPWEVAAARCLFSSSSSRGGLRYVKYNGFFLGSLSARACRRPYLLPGRTNHSTPALALAHARAQAPTSPGEAAAVSAAAAAAASAAPASPATASAAAAAALPCLPPRTLSPERAPTSPGNPGEAAAAATAAAPPRSDPGWSWATASPLPPSPLPNPHLHLRSTSTGGGPGPEVGEHNNRKKRPAETLG